MFTNVTFENPAWFWLLIAIPVVVLWYIYKRKESQVPVKFSTTSIFSKSNFWGNFKHLLFGLKLLAWISLTIAMA